MPGDELWQLCRIAFEQYKSEISNGEKAYSRFIYDFLYYHLPVSGMTEADMRTHFMHVCEVVELLDDLTNLHEEVAPFLAVKRKEVALFVFLRDDEIGLDISIGAACEIAEIALT